jgi:hypothetical protein
MGSSPITHATSSATLFCANDAMAVMASKKAVKNLSFTSIVVFVKFNLQR